VEPTGKTLNEPEQPHCIPEEPITDQSIPAIISVESDTETQNTENPVELPTPNPLSPPQLDRKAFILKCLGDPTFNDYLVQVEKLLIDLAQDHQEIRAKFL